MAAKLKKRALAEYQTQVLTEETVHSDGSTGAGSDTGSTSAGPKRLRIQHPSSSSSQHRKAGRLISLSRSLSQHGEPASVDTVVTALERASKPQELSTALIQLSPRITQKILERRELQDVVTRICDLASKPLTDELVREQIYLSLTMLIKSYIGSGVNTSGWSDVDASELCNLLRQVLKERCDEWVHQLSNEKDTKVVAAILTLLAEWYGCGQRIGTMAQATLLEMTKKSLKSEGHQVKMNALRVLGTSLATFTSSDRSLANDLVSLVGRYTLSSDSRVRTAAFEALLEMHQRGQKLDMSMYVDFCSALSDDYEGVRKVAIKLIYVLAQTYHDEQVRVRPDSSEGVRLADDAFAKICNSVNDLSVAVREEAVLLIGNMTNISEDMLEQTLDKKLMSNMRRKTSAHQRTATMVASGEWSSGKKWADDAPREELDPESINVMSFGACGAFVHGLEDEFMAVRSQSIKSLTKQSVNNPKLASLALDYLVDMFNDEIELVRLEAIESLTTIANHITLQVHQLETILSALDDFSVVVREKLHIMLQASTIATKDGLENVISKLVENLKRYPQDRRSILATFKRLGHRHAELTLPLVSQLLEIHPFFDTAEPDIEDPAYLCILVLVFNAAHRCPTLRPLLDQYTKRHYHYLVDTYPHLVPHNVDGECDANSISGDGTEVLPARKTTTNFLHQVLERVKTSAHLKLEARIQILERARIDLKRLGSIELALSDSAAFAELYIHCQCLLLRCLGSQFWLNSGTMQTQQLEIVESEISELFRLCAQLEHRFIRISPSQRRQIRLLKLNIMAVRLVFVVRASNKSALLATESFLREIERIRRSLTTEEIESSTFFAALLKKFADFEERKPGAIVRLVQPLLLTHPVESLSFSSDVAKSHAVIYEPTGENETPLKYTAGMVLAVPVDAELFNLTDDYAKLVRLAIKTPDQKVLMVTPMASQFFKKDQNCRRLLTKAIMSHQVWSDALHVEISIVLDLSSAKEMIKFHSQKQDKDKDAIIPLCDPVKVYVLPKAIKRGI